MWESGISGWQADWRAGSEQIERHADRLLGLVGAHLTGAWTVWIGDDDWFADMPVVLQFDSGDQLEVCWQKLDDLSLSWNTINVASTPRAWIENLSWRPWLHAALEAIRDEIITGIAATEFEWSTSDVDYPHRPRPSTMLTGGLLLQTSAERLHIFNALDENGLALDPLGDHVTPLRPSH